MKILFIIGGVLTFACAAVFFSSIQYGTSSNNLILINNTTMSTNSSQPVPKEITALLPENGALFIKGGLLSAGGRVIIDLDKKTVSWYFAKKPNSSPFGRSLFAKRIKLVDSDAQKLTELIQAVERNGATLPDRNTITIDATTDLYVTSGGRVMSFTYLGPEPQGAPGELMQYCWRLIGK